MKLCAYAARGFRSQQYIFGIFLSEVLFETLHQIIYSIAKHEQRNHSDVKAICEKLNDFA